AAFLRFGGNGQLQYMVQSRDLALYASAAIHVDERISAGSENIAGADDVRTAKQNQAVAVGMGVRLVIDNDGLAIEVQVLGGWRGLVDGEGRLFKLRCPRCSQPIE